MTTEEVISRIQDVLNADYHYDETIGYQLTSYDFDWLNMAITTLRAQQNKQLTIFELLEMIGEPVWITELASGREYWAIIKTSTDDGVFMTTVEDFNDYGSFPLYGKTWLAYRYRPKES